ncbi:MAG: N-6 DNA methylase [Candidatus Sericytochromatia bacterium]|nr:N-6 DNA methylase [Candidatus Sericytochromatia bacterium]
MHPEQRIDQHLLNNLQQLAEALQQKMALARPLANLLIGKFIYIHYLVARGIVTEDWLQQIELSLAQVTGEQITAHTLTQLSQALEQRFNGQVFPVPLSQLGDQADDIVRFVASIFRGDQVSGQLVLPGFKLYDFAAIPIELLSAIYEQFLNTEGSNRGKEHGAVYTPEFLADYLLRELNSVHPLKPGMTILDPACGSGVFLVLAYRQLIEQWMRENQKKPTLKQLADLLTEHIYGVEKIQEACYVTEFSLLLMLLNYVDPPDLAQNPDFRFPTLHNQNIFEADFFDESAGIWPQQLTFDWVVGNPPWTQWSEKELKQNQPHLWAWIQTHKNTCPVGQYSPSEAFSWRVSDALKSNGHAGLLIKATSLVNQKSLTYRRQFFKRYQVKRITNLSNLMYQLFLRRADAPAATLIYQCAALNEDKPPIVHYGPFAANQLLGRSFASQTKGKKQAWMLTVYEDEIHSVSAQEAETGDALTWKLALWGSAQDRLAIGRLKRLFPLTLGELVKKQGWKLHEGRNIQSEQKGTARYPILDMPAFHELDSGVLSGQLVLSVPAEALKSLDKTKSYFYDGRSSGLQVAAAPHLYLSSSSAAYSDLDFFVSKSQSALAAPQADAEYLRALSAYLSSSVGRYLLFFHAAAWGVGRTNLNPSDFKTIPIPEFNAEQIKDLAKWHHVLSGQQVAHLFITADLQKFVHERLKISGIQKELDQRIAKILKIPSSLMLIVQDFMHVRYQINKGKTQVAATKAPTKEQLLEYAQELRQTLDAFADVRHQVTLIQYPQLIACQIELTRYKQAETPELEPIIKREQKISREEQALWEALGQKFSQWVYVQRGLRVIHDRTCYIWKTPRLLDWTRTQAIADADELIAEVLNYQGEFV